ncbi:MAG: hypothetical protein H6703_15725 [Myxococcales bacterium]|nr:hypothetical protein [Myxococcales bacterium]
MHGPTDALTLRPSLDEDGGVLVVHIAPLVTERRWPMWYDRLLVRSAVFPSKLHPDTTTLRMRLTRPMREADLRGIHLTPTPGGATLHIPRPASEPPTATAPDPTTLDGAAAASR